MTQLREVRLGDADVFLRDDLARADSWERAL